MATVGGILGLQTQCPAGETPRVQNSWRGSHGHVFTVYPGRHFCQFCCSNFCASGYWVLGVGWGRHERPTRVRDVAVKSQLNDPLVHDIVALFFCYQKQCGKKNASKPTAETHHVRRNPGQLQSKAMVITETPNTPICFCAACIICLHTLYIYTINVYILYIFITLGIINLADRLPPTHSLSRNWSNIEGRSESGIYVFQLCTHLYIYMYIYIYVHVDLQINIFSCQLTHHHLPQISSFQASTACTTIGSAVSSSVTEGRSDTGQPEISSSMAEQPSTQLAWAFHGPKAEWLKIYVTYLWDNKWDLNIYSPNIYIFIFICIHIYICGILLQKRFPRQCVLQCFLVEESPIHITKKGPMG